MCQKKNKKFFQKKCIWFIKPIAFLFKRKCFLIYNLFFTLSNSYLFSIRRIKKIGFLLGFVLLLIHGVIGVYNNDLFQTYSGFERSQIIVFLEIFTLTSTICVATCTNPIFGLLNLIASVVSIVVILLSCKIQFFPLLILIVYVGAISILFLFTIMLFNLKQKPSFFVKSTVIIFVLILAYLSKLIVFTVIKHSVLIENIIYELNNDISVLTHSFYGSEYALVIKISVVLLATMLSAFTLGNVKTDKKMSHVF